MNNIERIINQMSNNVAAFQALVQPIPAEQAGWKPDSETWSLKEVMEHVYNEERLDFRKHLKEMLSDPPQPWERFRPENLVVTESCSQALDYFLKERKASLKWLRSLVAPDWNVTSRLSFDDSGDGFVLSAGDVLVSWVAHDFLHIRQVNELLYRHHTHTSSPFSVRYAGDW